MIDIIEHRADRLPRPGGAGRILGELVRTTLDRLIELSTATNKRDEVKKWRAELAKYPKVGPLPEGKK